MRNLTCSIGIERDDIVNNWYAVRETSSAVTKLLQAIIAYDGDDKDDDDGYWHP